MKEKKEPDTPGQSGVILAYYEGFATKREAMQRECEIKKMTRRQKDALMDF